MSARAPTALQREEYYSLESNTIVRPTWLIHSGDMATTNLNGMAERRPKLLANQFWGFFEHSRRSLNL